MYFLVIQTVLWNYTDILGVRTRGPRSAVSGEFFGLLTECLAEWAMWCVMSWLVLSKKLLWLRIWWQLGKTSASFHCLGLWLFYLSHQWLQPLNFTWQIWAKTWRKSVLLSWLLDASIKASGRILATPTFPLKTSMAVPVAPALDHRQYHSICMLCLGFLASFAIFRVIHNYGKFKISFAIPKYRILW